MDLPSLFDALRSGDRAALGRAITLIESTRAKDLVDARALVRHCLPFSGASLRVGITGIPGVGKSTLIDALGLLMIDGGHRVAVLAIDPTSDRSSGSILGDKTRMERLSLSDRAFVRPSPTSGALGGVAHRTRETIILCEAAGYDRVLIETVGVGQSELAVDRMTDLNVLLMIGGAGDELQGIKRGIMEAADLMVVTKNDGGNEALGQRAANDLRQAISLMPARESGVRPAVLLCSAWTGKGLSEVVEHIQELALHHATSGYTEQRRREQNRWWLRSAIEENLLREFYHEPGIRAALDKLEAAVVAGSTSPFDAADELLRLFRTTSAPRP